MQFERGSFTEVDGQINGTTEHELAIFVLVNSVHEESSYFANMSFISAYDFRTTSHITRGNVHRLGDAMIVNTIDRAATIDPNDPELVIKAYENIKRQFRQQDVRLILIHQATTIQSVNLSTDEYLEVQKYNALKKLSVDEIQMLGLEKEAVHLKLKYEKPKGDDDLIF